MTKYMTFNEQTGEYREATVSDAEYATIDWMAFWEEEDRKIARYEATRHTAEATHDA